MKIPFWKTRGTRYQKTVMKGRELHRKSSQNYAEIVLKSSTEYLLISEYV